MGGYTKTAKVVSRSKEITVRIKDYEYLFNSVIFFSKDERIQNDISNVPHMILDIVCNCRYVVILDVNIAKKLFDVLKINSSFDSVDCEFSKGSILEHRHETWYNLSDEIARLQSVVNRILEETK